MSSPDNFDDIPSSTSEITLKLLDDFTVASHRAIQSLQIAVNDENQVVEFFAPSQREGAKRFRFITFTVAQKSPNFSITHFD